METPATAPEPVVEDLAIPTPPGASPPCAAAIESYNHASTFQILFTGLVLVLVAATVAFLVAMLGFLLWTIREWNDDQIVDQAIKVVAALVSAAGSLVTGVAARSVNTARRYQDTQKDKALTKVNELCSNSVKEETVRQGPQPLSFF